MCWKIFDSDKPYDKQVVELRVTTNYLAVYDEEDEKFVSLYEDENSITWKAFSADNWKKASEVFDLKSELESSEVVSIIQFSIKKHVNHIFLTNEEIKKDLCHHSLRSFLLFFLTNYDWRSPSYPLEIIVESTLNMWKLILDKKQLYQIYDELQLEGV